MAKKKAAKTSHRKRDLNSVVTPTMREVILRAIEESGESLRSIAANTGISQPQLSRFVNDERDLRLGAADKIAKYFKLKLVRDDDDTAD